MLNYQALTNMNIFSRALTIDEMVENTKENNCNMEGDYLAWREMSWNLKGEAVIDTEYLDQSCKEHPIYSLYPKSTFVVPFSTISSCMNFCEKLGNRALSVTTLTQWKKIERFLKTTFEGQRTNDFPDTWLALNDIAIEGEWRDYYSEEKVNFSLPWAKAEPTGGRDQNCLQLSFSNGTAYTSDLSCTEGSGGSCLCERNPLPYLRLRGLCSKWNLLDLLYQPRNDMTDFTKLTFVSMKTSIGFNREHWAWNMKPLVLTDSLYNMTGTSIAPYESFTLGKHNWTIRGDKFCTRDGTEYTTELKMSGCLEGNFTCDDGQCIRMEQRCDQLPDCRDKSDERNCKILVLEKDYNKNVPPVVSKEDGTKVLIGVSIDLLKLVDIKEEDHAIEIQFSITLKWKENRAIYHNLKKEKTLNALTNNDIERLWLPELIYENTDQKETTRLGVQWEWKTIVVVNRQGNFTRSTSDIVDEIEIFDGAENNMEMSQTYTHDFQCVFVLKYYPFDTQVKV